MWGAPSPGSSTPFDPSAAAALALRQEMQAKIQKELDEIAAATPELFRELKAYPAPVPPSRPVLASRGDSGSGTDSTAEDDETSLVQKHEHINDSRHRKHRERRRKRSTAGRGSSDPASVEEEMAAFFYELEQAGFSLSLFRPLARALTLSASLRRAS